MEKELIRVPETFETQRPIPVAVVGETKLDQIFKPARIFQDLETGDTYYEVVKWVAAQRLVYHLLRNVFSLCEIR